MSEMVERVAAVFDPEAFADHPAGVLHSVQFISRRSRAREKARAAIKALMEPTEAMKRLGVRYSNLAPDDDSNEHYVSSIYQAMLTAALEEDD